MDLVLLPLIRESGPISFETFMELALYHEEFGYYSDPGRLRVGREGDFATNVSVGETFGRLLALRLYQFWQGQGRPKPFHILELGPEDGSLALDILNWSLNIDEEYHQALTYLACEHSSRKRSSLETRFAEIASSPEVCALPTSRVGDCGVILANEVLDALPVRLLRRSSDRWQEKLVSEEEGSLIWAEREFCSPLPMADPLPFPEGYQTEVSLRLPSFFASLAPLFDRSLSLFIDYGFSSEDYYHPDRTEGTLRTYAHQQAGDNPLQSPGLIDLTAHVDFTTTLRAAEQAGFQGLGFARQESYLTFLAQSVLQQVGGNDLSFIRQFRTLTHPGFFGSRFQVLELTRGISPGSFSFPCPNDGLVHLA